MAVGSRVRLGVAAASCAVLVVAVLVVRAYRGAEPAVPEGAGAVELARLGHQEMERATQSANVQGHMRPSPRARKLFGRALARDAKNLDALRGMASWYEFHDKPQKALAMDERLIAAHPKNLNARTHKGRCLLLLKRYAAAEAALNDALKLATAAGDARVEVTARELLGKVYTLQRRYTEAERVLVRAVEQAEETRMAACPYAALGELYRITERPAKLVAVDVRAADMESDKPKMQHHAAISLRLSGDYDRALKYVRRAMALHRAPEYLKLRDEILADQKTRSPGEELRIGLAAFVEGRYRRAHVHLNRVRAKDLRGQAMVVRGFMLLLEKKYAGADTLFSGARAAGGETGAEVGLGHVAIIRKDFAAARRLLAPAVVSGEQALAALEGEAASGHVEVTYRMACLGMGWLDANTGRHRQALSYFERILKHDDADVFALLGKGNSHNALGQLKQAEGALRQVLKLKPGNRFALAELALVMFNRGKDGESERLFRAALARDPTRYTCPHEGLGMIYLRAGKLAKARESFSRAIKINPDIEYKKFNGLARILIREGAHARARVLLRKSMINYPHDDEAKKLLASIEGK